MVQQLHLRPIHDAILVSVIGLRENGIAKFVFFGEGCEKGRFQSGIDGTALLLAFSAADDIAVLRVDGSVPAPVWRGDTNGTLPGEPVAAGAAGTADVLEITFEPKQGAICASYRRAKARIIGGQSTSCA
ncbi:MAG: hypothetical protein HC888_15025 [Candidatus Competibacteraceae bacterium]|nr:hypothetical protein [Candidatus Competibacteraceae bacterium]